MNALLATVAATVLANTPSTGPGVQPVVTVAPLNPNTAILIAPATGQVLIAIDTGGGGSALLIVNQSPALALPMTDPHARAASGVTLLTGLR